MSSTNLQTSVSQKINTKDFSKKDIGSLIPDRHGGTPFFRDKAIMGSDMEKRRMYVDKIRKGQICSNIRGSLTYEVRIPERFNGTYCVQFSPNGDEIATGFGSGVVQVRDITGEVTGTLKCTINRSVMAIKYHPTVPDVFYASCLSGFIYTCLTRNGHCDKFCEEKENEINTIDINAEGTVIASGGKDAAIRTYDTETALITDCFKNDNENIDDKHHSMRIFSLKFREGKRNVMISGGWDGTVRVWDIRQKGGCVRCIHGPYICGHAIDTMNNVILTGSWFVKNSLQKWDIGSGKLIETIVPTNRPASVDGEFLYCAQFFDGDPTGDTVITGGSGTGNVEVISVREKKVVASFRASKAVQALDTHDINIVYGGMESTIRLAEFI